MATAAESGRVPSAPGSHPSGHAAFGVDGASRFDPSRDEISAHVRRAVDAFNFLKAWGFLTKKEAVKVSHRIAMQKCREIRHRKGGE